MRTIVTGTGSYLPERVVTNDELATMITTSDEWIQQRSGICERRYASDEDTPGTMGAEAARKAIEMAGLEIEDIDYLICSTQTPEFLFPGTGCVVQDHLGCSGIPALDVRDQCTGFLYALSVAHAYIQAGMYKNILIVCTELHSRGLQFEDEGRHVTVLFGDGAGALVVSADQEEGESGLKEIELHADGKYAEELIVRGPGFRFLPNWCAPHVFEEGHHYPKMNGRAVFKHAVTNMRATTAKTLEKTGWTGQDLDHFIPHQANLRINEAVAKEFDLDLSIVDSSIRKYGNCASASVPIALDEKVRSGAIKKGDKIGFTTFAAGFTWGAASLVW